MLSGLSSLGIMFATGTSVGHRMSHCCPKYKRLPLLRLPTARRLIRTSNTILVASTKSIVTTMLFMDYSAVSCRFHSAVGFLHRVTQAGSRSEPHQYARHGRTLPCNTSGYLFPMLQRLARLLRRRSIFGTQDRAQASHMLFSLPFYHSLGRYHM
jgi:hypothetical protein